MLRVMLVHPNKWGRGITAIWIPSHAGVARDLGHDVQLFDATFYRDWTVDETTYNTENRQYKPSDYHQHITYSDTPIRAAFEEAIHSFKPDVILLSAFSSHIHGEGEYVNIQYSYQLLEGIEHDAFVVAGGLQATADPEGIVRRFPFVDVFIRGESELVFGQILSSIESSTEWRETPGLAFKDGDSVLVNPPQEIISDMDAIPMYDYSVFENQAFWRPYNGEVLKAVDYELSRGCPFSCTYCVETVIQKYYGFEEIGASGVIKNSRKYLRNKSAERAFMEIKYLHEHHGITLFRCQDTNFLSIEKSVLKGLADKFDEWGASIKLYIETRPETITPANIELLLRLKVDGVGMGVELASEDFRKSSLNRFPSQERIFRAFDLLKEAGIRRTAYNIIGLPNEGEEEIIETVLLNRELDPDNVTVAFYSPYIGTIEQRKSNDLDYFDEYEYHVDGQLRTLTRSSHVDSATLEFYKKHFVRLISDGIEIIDELKKTDLDEG